MGQPQQRRLAPALAPGEVGQAAVIKPAAHAQAPTHIIEAHQRQQHEIECPYRALAIGIHARFKNAKAVGQQLIPRPNTLKYHLGARPGTQHRQVSGLAPALSGAQQQARIDFTVRR